MEQMLVNLMISEMRKSVPENDVIPLSQGERIFRDMLDQEYAGHISESGSLGIADLIVAQMRGQR
ncbi:MAG: rod-binding protein [Deltaproteobacteria bacterium]|nr:rod-binding protein [Deltaproteobacteria bacterium]